MLSVFPISDSWLFVLGTSSAVLAFCAYLPYMRDVLRGVTQPQRASWLIWSLLSSIALAAQVYEGASTSLWFAGSQVASTWIVFLLSIARGQGAFLSRPDERALWLATVGIVIWYFTDNAVYALALTITISLLGGVLTVTKAYQDPESETLSTWVLSFGAACLAILSVGTLDWALLAYPLYLFVLKTAIITAILLGRSSANRYAAMGLPRF
ncbi:hypothetical protein [Tateyamaria sp. SN6-1]|uniref:hypothetical protein n=1 Tax=Tateyamaria sp. SN6-1 TaxID=3092148 RepID=UPI0039F61E90